MLTAGRIVFPVIGTHAYFLAVKIGQFGLASALALTMVPLLLVVLLVLFRLFDRAERTERIPA
jgi:ABC-type sugar transport system permease subunit